ncbi:MAG: hypothetical protein ACREO8_11465, partial [Luteimonas sp.]
MPTPPLRIKDRRRDWFSACGLALAIAAASVVWSTPGTAPAQGKQTLRSPAAFATITDLPQRSAALFREAGKVLQHPRCVNCHPVTDRPLQSDQGLAHEPAVRRGADGFGVPGLRCQACHQASNYDVAGIPGHPQWHLAPASMAWQG